MPAADPKNVPPAPGLSFENTEIAFRNKNNSELNKAYWLFKIISSNFLAKIGPPATSFAMHIGLPIKGLIKSTIFKQFCGGETIPDCETTIQQLARGKVGTILDYSVEGEEDEKAFNATADEIIKTIKRAEGDANIPLTVFKVTGIGRFGLLEKLDAGEELTMAERAELVKMKSRADMICRAGFESGVPVMIDAEESWIQDTIDQLALDMMKRYNREKAIVYNTYQLYRHDKLAALTADLRSAAANGFLLGAKLVRGAYMEKERKRASEMSYPSPIQPDKESTDRDYTAALALGLSFLDHAAFVVGTHNEASCALLVEKMARENIPAAHTRIFFSQLLGMSDNLSFNLADAGYSVAKYVPYGPVEAVMPYLFRRAQENTSISGQTGRELGLIIQEKARRRKG